jgi:hypothetical protein
LPSSAYRIESEQLGLLSKDFSVMKHGRDYGTWTSRASPSAGVRAKAKVPSLATAKAFLLTSRPRSRRMLRRTIAIAGLQAHSESTKFRLPPGVTVVVAFQPPVPREKGVFYELDDQRPPP